MSPTAQRIANEALFEKCVKRKVEKGGQLTIRCKLGLWDISGSDHEMIERGARHYWIQYVQDGEYAKLLARVKAPASAVEKTHETVMQPPATKGILGVLPKEKP